MVGLVGRYRVQGLLRRESALSATRRLHRMEHAVRRRCLYPTHHTTTVRPPRVGFHHSSPSRRPHLLASVAPTSWADGVSQQVKFFGSSSRRLPQDGLGLQHFIASSASSVYQHSDAISTEKNATHSVGEGSSNSSIQPDTGRSFFIKTYGCQMNVSDSDILRTLLREAGYREEVTSEEDADVVLTNTCAIRDKAEQRVWTRLHQIKQRQKQKQKQQQPPHRRATSKQLQQVVGVVGCMAERLQTKLLDEGVADLVLGPDRYRELPQRLEELLNHNRTSNQKSESSNAGDEMVVRNTSADTLNAELPAMNSAGLHLRSAADESSRPTSTDRTHADRRRKETYDDILPFHEPSRISSFVSIQRGCSNHCAFCIVPHVRGPERSRPLESILNETRTLIDQGVKEITLLGQNVNSYHDTSSATSSSVDDDYTMSNAGFRSRVRRPAGGYWFADLLDAVASLDREVRVRFTSPHPKDYPPALLELMGEAATSKPNLCRQLHMPAQSGSTTVLARMKRGYSRDAYLELIDAVRESIPDVALSTDMIAGFCGETDDEHQDSVSLLERVRYEQAFLFAYSLREPTLAARALKDDVPPHVKQARLQTLIDTFQRNVQLQNEKEVGRLRLVLVEGPAKKTPGLWTGRTDQNKRILWSGNQCEWDWKGVRGAVPLVKERIVSSPKAVARPDWINEQLRNFAFPVTNRDDSAVRVGDYAVVEVTEAKGIGLRGRLLWKCSLQDFHESQIGDLAHQETSTLLLSWLDNLSSSEDFALPSATI